jgi:hypothetical protein
MKFDQYIHILLVAGSTLTALITLIASDSRVFIFCRLISTDILGISERRAQWSVSFFR